MDGERDDGAAPSRARRPSVVLHGHPEHVVAAEPADEVGVVALDVGPALPRSASAARRASGERCARRQLALAPLRETGAQLLMEVLAAQGNPAEPLVVYEELRLRLREAIGVASSQGMQELHRRLLGA